MRGAAARARGGRARARDAARPGARRRRRPRRARRAARTRRRPRDRRAARAARRPSGPSAAKLERRAPRPAAPPRARRGRAATSPTAQSRSSRRCGRARRAEAQRRLRRRPSARRRRACATRRPAEDRWRPPNVAVSLTPAQSRRGKVTRHALPLRPALRFVCGPVRRRPRRLRSAVRRRAGRAEPVAGGIVQPYTESGAAGHANIYWFETQSGPIIVDVPLHHSEAKKHPQAASRRPYRIYITAARAERFASLDVMREGDVPALHHAGGGHRDQGLRRATAWRPSASTRATTCRRTSRRRRRPSRSARTTCWARSRSSCCRSAPPSRRARWRCTCPRPASSSPATSSPARSTSI